MPRASQMLLLSACRWVLLELAMLPLVILELNKVLANNKTSVSFYYEVLFEMYVNSDGTVDMHAD